MRPYHQLVQRTGHALTILAPPVSLLAYLQTTRPSLVEDLHGRTADLSARWFYGLLDQHRAEQGCGACSWVCAPRRAAVAT